MAEGKDIGFGANLGESVTMDMYQREKERIQKLDEPERSEAIRVLTASYPELAASLAEDLGYAEKMMDTAMPEGRMAGQVYVAANPLEHLSSALRQGYGAKMRADTKKDQAQMRSDMQKGRAGFYAGDGQSNPAVAAAVGRSMKPDLTQYGVQGVDGGMGQQTPRPQPQPQSAPKAQALRAPAPAPAGMGGMGKPDLGRYGAPTVNAGMGQQTPRQATAPAPDDSNLMREQNPFDNDPMAAIPRSDEQVMAFGVAKDPNVSMSPDRKKMLDELMSRRNLRGY